MRPSGPARQHALDRLLDDALGELALEDRLGGALFDAADIAGVVVIDLLVALAAGEHHLVGVDDDDVVAVVHVGREGGLVLAAQAHGDDRREAADDEALGVDEKPFLLDVGRLGRMGLAEHELGFRHLNARRGGGQVRARLIRAAMAPLSTAESRELPGKA